MSKSIPRVSIVLPNGHSDAVRQSSPASFSGNDGVFQGDITLIKVCTPNFTNNVTTTVRIFDRKGLLKFISEAIPRNLTASAGGYFIYPPVPIPIEWGEYLTAQPSGDPGGTGGTVTIDLEWRPDVFMNIG